MPHPDGSYWFTDPPYGGSCTRAAGRGGRPQQPCGRLNPRLGQPPELGRTQARAAHEVYRVDPSGTVDLVVEEDQVPDPNGLVFSPDYKRLYVVSTGRGPGDTGPGGKGEMYVFDVGTDNKLSNGRSSPTSWSTG